METSKDQLEVVHVQCQLQYEIFLLLFYSLLLRMTDKLSSVKSRENLTIIRPHQDPSLSDSDQGSKIIDKFEPGFCPILYLLDISKIWPAQYKCQGPWNEREDQFIAVTPFLSIYHDYDKFRDFVFDFSASVCPF